MSDKPNYYAVLTAEVRYDKDLPMGARLLYGEITALCNDKGFCWAGNEYFSNLYDCSHDTITRWVRALEKKGYIRTEIKKEMGNVRYIFLIATSKNEGSYPQKYGKGTRKTKETPTRKIKGYNTTKNNTTENTTNNKSKKITKENQPTMEEVQRYVDENNIDLDAGHFYKVMLTNMMHFGFWSNQSGKPILNWKTTVLNWSKYETYQKKQTSVGVSQYQKTKTGVTTQEGKMAGVKVLYDKYKSQEGVVDVIQKQIP